MILLRQDQNEAFVNVEFVNVKKDLMEPRVNVRSVKNRVGLLTGYVNLSSHSYK